MWRRDKAKQSGFGLLGRGANSSLVNVWGKVMRDKDVSGRLVCVDPPQPIFIFNGKGCLSPPGREGAPHREMGGRESAPIGCFSIALGPK